MIKTNRNIFHIFIHIFILKSKTCIMHIISCKKTKINKQKQMESTSTIVNMFLKNSSVCYCFCSSILPRNFFIYNTIFDGQRCQSQKDKLVTFERLKSRILLTPLCGGLCAVFTLSSLLGYASLGMVE